MRPRGWIILLVLILIAAYPAWLVWTRAPARSSQPVAMPETVSDLVVAPQDWQDRLETFGQVRAVQGADLSAQVPGIVDTIAFQSGQEVKAGTVLLRLRLYDDSAKLAQLQALVSLWQANLARDEKQFAVQAISHATLDLDTANLHQFEAQEAAQSQAIEEKIVRAPFDGKLGIRQVDLGQYLPPGTTITTLEALDPIYVDFNVVQQRLGDIRPGQVVGVSVDAYPGRVFEAKVQAIDSHIDLQSRMVPVRAALDNKDRALLPGMFAVAHLDIGARRSVIAVPQGAVSFNPYGDFVYVLTPKPGSPGVMLATSRVVTLGARQGDLVVIEHGLQAGETVVSAGQFKLRSGSLVRIDNTVQPAKSRAPDPVEE